MVIDVIIEWHFHGHGNRALLKVVSWFPRGHEDHISYLLVVRVPRLTWGEDLGNVVYMSLNFKFMSILIVLDDEDCTDNLVCC